MRLRTVRADVVCEKMSKKGLLYGFSIFNSQGMCFDAIRSILCEQKICVNNGALSIYAPYKELNSYMGKQMCGIGFSLKALGKWAEIHQPKVESFFHSGLQSCRIYTNEIDLSCFDVKQNDYFLIVPCRSDMKRVCFGDKVPKTKYYYWRCKGICNQDNAGKTDEEIRKYLNEGYRFDSRNLIPIKEEDLYRSKPLYGNTSYNWVNLTPNEIGQKREMSIDVFSGSLF